MSKPDQILKSNLENLANIYLLNGDRYLLNNFLNRFKARFITNETANFDFEEIDEKNSNDFIDKLINSISLLPFQNQKRLVITHLESIAKNSTITKNIELIAKKIPDSTILILVTNSSINQQRKHIKRILEVAELIKFKKLQYRNLDNWIKEKANKHNKNITKKAINLLEASFNNNLQRLETELDKIITFLNDKDTIDEIELRKIISKDIYLKENVIFDFVDAIGEKNNSKAMLLLREILKQDKNVKRLLIMIERQFRLLLQVKLLSSKGYTASEIASKINEHSYPVKKCLKQTNNFSLNSLKKSFSILHESDINLVSKGQQELEIELLLLKLINLN